MKLLSMFICAVLCAASLCLSHTARAQAYSQTSFTAHEDKNVGNGSYVISTQQCSITALSGNGNTASDEVVTCTSVWTWAGGGAPTDPFSLTGQAHLSGNASTGTSASSTGTGVTAAISFSNTSSAAPGTYSTSPDPSATGDFQPNAAGKLTAVVQGEAKTTSGNGFASASAVSKVWVHQ